MKKSMFFMTIVLAVMLISCEDTSDPSNQLNDPKPAYDTIKIGTQVWMKKNLDVDHYRNGDSIPEVRDSATWANLTTGAWCYYNNNSANDSIYGKLYNWYAVNDPRRLAPNGWHVPSDGEWKTLEIYLGMKPGSAEGDYYRGSNAGSKLAGRGDLWQNGKLIQDQDFAASGFSAFPGGFRDRDGDFGYFRVVGFWWTATEESQSSGAAWERYLDPGNTTVYRTTRTLKWGLSVRCVKD